MIRYTPRALGQIASLQRHCRRKERYQALVRLNQALDEAERRIAATPTRGVSAPAVYPHLSRPGRLWLRAWRYWIVYRVHPPLILAVFDATADIPRRLKLQ